MRTIGNILFVGMLVMNYVGQLPSQEKSPAILLQEALYQEETEGNLDKAMELYGQVLTQAADVERLAARAAYQLGLCHLKKDNPTEAAVWFGKVVSDYPKQASVVKKAQAQLDKIAPAEQAILFEELPEAVLMEIGNMYGRTCGKAGLLNLYTNSNIHYVNSDFVSYRGGYGYYTNHLNTPLTQKVRLSGTSYPNQYHYDIAGRRMNTEIVQDDNRKNFYHIYWTPEEALPPGQFFMYGWCVTEANKVPMAPGAAADAEKHVVTIQNHFGNHAFEVFYLVIPNTLQVTETSEPQTEVKTVEDYTIHAWEKEVQPDENHKVTAYVTKAKPAGKPDKLKAEDLAAEGWQLWQQRKLAEAEAKFKEAIKADPQSEGAWQGLGWAQQNQGKKLNAEESFKKCVELNPQNAAALNGLGWIAHGNGNIDLAIRWWEKAVQAEPGATAALVGLTQTYMEKEQYAQAAKYYQMWLKAEPNSQNAKEGLAKAKSLMK